MTIGELNVMATTLRLFNSQGELLQKVQPIAYDQDRSASKFSLLCKPLCPRAMFGNLFRLEAGMTQLGSEVGRRKLGSRYHRCFSLWEKTQGKLSRPKSLIAKAPYPQVRPNDSIGQIQPADHRLPTCVLGYFFNTVPECM